MQKILLLLALPALAGCSSLGRGLLNGAGAAAGGGAGYALAGNDAKKRPLYTLGGAAIGAIGTELLQGKDKAALTEGYDKGYTQASSDSIKRHYWLRQELEKSGRSQASSGQTVYYTMPVQDSAIGGDGVDTVPHSVTIPIVE